MNEHDHRPRRGLLWPLILIVIGALFLLNNLNALDDGVWGTLVGLWPILFIALGLNGLIRRREVVGPVFLFSVSGAFLLVNFDVLGNEVWWTLMRFWPLLLVAGGLEIMFRRKSVWLSLVSVVVVMAILAGGVWYAGVFDSANSEIVTEQISQPMGDFSEADITLAPGVASLKLQSEDDFSQFIEGTVQPWKGENITPEFSVSGDTATFALESHMKTNTFNPARDFHHVWDLTLNETVAYALNVNLGVGDAALDLSGLTLTSLDVSSGVGVARIDLPGGEYRVDVEAGVGETVVTLNETGDITLIVSGGVGSTVIWVPEGAAVKISVDRGLSGLQIPSGYEKRGDTYTSPGYADAEQQIEVSVDMGVGNISIREK